MTRFLKVSRSRTYAWAAKDEAERMGPDPCQAFVEDLDQHIYAIWEDSDEVYGTLRITVLLARRTVKANRKTVARRMRAVAIEGISPHAFVLVTTIASKKKSTLPDLVKQLLDVGELNCVWSSDIIYLRTGESLLHLCVVRDGHSHHVIYWTVDDTQSTDLVQQVLQMAYTSRDGTPEGLVFYANRGRQYTRDQIWRVCQDLGTIV